MKHTAMRREGAGLLRIVCAAALLLFAAGEAQALFGWGGKGDDKIGAALKRAGELAREAELAWANDGDAARAVALYQQAVDLCLEAEANHPKGDLGSVRFHRAFCETQIDRVKFDAATGPQRRVAVMPTPAPTNPAVAQPAAAPAAQPVAASVVAGPVAAPVATATAETPAAASAPLGAAEIAEEVAWARDMLDHDGTGESRTALMKVLRTDPGHREARLLLAVLECREKRFQDALLILEDLRAEREDETIHLLLSGAYLGIGQPYRAMLELDKLLKNTPAHPDALMNMAYLTMELSAKTAEAEMYYRLAVKHGAPRDQAFEKRLGL